MFAFPAKRQKRLPFLRQSASITYILFLYMAVSTCLTSISRKVPPSELPAAVTGISFLSAYLFAAVYASAPEKFLHPSDNSSPVSSLKRITVACQSGSLTPLPLVILVHWFCCVYSFCKGVFKTALLCTDYHAYRSCARFFRPLFEGFIPCSSSFPQARENMQNSVHLLCAAAICSKAEKIFQFPDIFSDSA